MSEIMRWIIWSYFEIFTLIGLRGLTVGQQTYFYRLNSKGGPRSTPPAEKRPVSLYPLIDIQKIWHSSLGKYQGFLLIPKLAQMNNFSGSYDRNRILSNLIFTALSLLLPTSLYLQKSSRLLLIQSFHFFMRNMLWFLW